MPNRSGAARPRRRMPAAGDTAAVFSLLDTYRYIVREDVRSLPADELVRLIGAGPLPISLMATLAEKCGFEAPELIIMAAASRAAGGLVGIRGPAAAGGAPSAVSASRFSMGKRGVEEAFALIFESLGERRDGQLEMALAVWRALEEDRVALLEAGTGTGKSLAYLVPCVLFSLQTGERVVVSTYTRNLQEQLFRKETPLLADVLGIEVGAERLMGRDNYLCSRSLDAAVRRIAADDTRRALAWTLFAGLEGAETVESLGGLRAEVDARDLAAPPRCPMNACGYAERCPLLRARKRARETRLLFVNHALLLTDYRQGGAVIGPYSRVIFDEAHNLEKCVMENLSVKVSRDGLRRILEPLRLGDKEDETWKLLAHELEQAGQCADRRRYRLDLSRKGRKLEKTFGEIFGGAEESLNAARSLRSTKTRYVDGGDAFAAISDAIRVLLSSINEFAESLKLIREVALSSDLSLFQQEVSFIIDELSSLAEEIKFLAKGADEESVFWLDWGADGSLREMCGSPMNVDRPFADYLETILGSAVFTSATLSQNGGFGFIKERLGLGLLDARPIELVIPSPFPFNEHCLILIVTGLGDPNEAGFGGEVGAIVRDLNRAARRRALVLFTSYRLCRSTSEYLERFELEGPVLVQGAGESREALSERFRRSPSGILLGVASFWEGVDFPGEELEILVIPKIPFPVPAEPIVEARAERLAALGEDAFAKLFLPEAILRMRQGAGRLIRRMDDRGVIAILDSRLETRPYAGVVLASLPSRNIYHVTAEECAARATEWLTGS